MAPSQGVPVVCASLYPALLLAPKDQGPGPGEPCGGASLWGGHPQGSVDSWRAEVPLLLPPGHGGGG